MDELQNLVANVAAGLQAALAQAPVKLAVKADLGTTGTKAPPHPSAGKKDSPQTPVKNPSTTHHQTTQSAPQQTAPTAPLTGVPIRTTDLAARVDAGCRFRNGTPNDNKNLGDTDVKQQDESNKTSRNKTSNNMAYRNRRGTRWDERPGARPPRRPRRPLGQPHERVIGEAPLLDRVIPDLVDNALKYSDGPVDIDITDVIDVTDINTETDAGAHVVLRSDRHRHLGRGPGQIVHPIFPRRPQPQPTNRRWAWA